ncbi:DUF4388 domain-containing protein [Streptomyces griseorubiginosus]|uniref:DUF4388 domain-containing protein n=1 Tax=Streptomyces griseorubiginosus TaxID=67304 RepID=UPI001AD69836|nr:DUF4388 domain-containing protein [Streptomyces griseorubiginosus]MBO4259456.1 hypothetical protein [Streptomyces griseorubiginosus]
MTPTARNVPALLQGLREGEFTGTVRVSGSPGGTIHLRDGLVGAIETPGAPSATSVLLTPGRIGDAAWLAACAAEPDADRLGGYLVAAGLIGAAELEVVCTAAVFDGAFAMALSPVGGWETGEREPTLLTTPGVEPRHLTEETTRRMASPAGSGRTPGELARLRPRLAADDGSVGVGVGAPGAGAAPRVHRGGAWLPQRYRELLGGVNGRRTPRDLAFALGRGVYPVLLDLVRLEALGLVLWGAGAVTGDRPSTAPRVTPGSPVATGSAPAAGPLPRRRPGGTSPAADRGEKGAL